ncbi:MAG: nucleoside triphosphate pyrophosphatase [Candidatus Nanopelagicales bacterium]
MSAARLVLASASPARLRLLRDAGVSPVVRVSSVDEPALLASLPAAVRDDPVEHCRTLARAKALDVASVLAADDSYRDCFVVGCDSVLDVAGVPYGKPADAAEALWRWENQLSGRSAVLRTGHAVVRLSDGVAVDAVESTVVHFASPSAAEVAAYVATGEPVKVAGAFTLDGLAAPFVRGVEGDPSNVVGLSLPRLRLLLADLGLRWPELWHSFPAPAGRGAEDADPPS